MLNVETLAEALHPLFTTTADQLAAATGLVRRRRLWTGPALAQALVFGWLDRPGASLERLAAHAGSSRQALAQRLSPEAVSFLAALLAHAMELALSARRAAVPLLRRFNGAYAEDCTTVALPEGCARDFPGCGGSGPGDGRAAVKVYLRYELSGGALAELGLQPGRRPDVAAGQEHAALPAGALRLADLGFFDLDLLRGYTRQQVHWVSRLPAHASVAVAGAAPAGIAALLAGQAGDRLDLAVRVGAGGELACRLLAWRCPPEVARRRRARLEKTARKKGRRVSQRQRELAGWAVLITDLPAGRLSAAEAWELYRARWQVELLFKRFKSQGGLARTAGLSRERALCELLAKLLGQVVANWASLLRGGPLQGHSAAKAAAVVQEAARLLRGAVGAPAALRPALARLAAELGRLRAGKRKRLTTRERLLDPTAAA